MRFGKTKKIIFFGGSRKLLSAVLYCIDKGLDCVVFSAQRHLAEEIEDGKTLRELLEKHAILYYESPDVNTDNRLPPLIDMFTIGFSIGGAWIIKQNLIDLFKKKIVNSHNTRLPRNRGGGAFSWPILMGDRKGGFAIHMLDAGTDTGDLVFYKEFLYPKTCSKPSDYFAYEFKKNDTYTKQFINTLQRGEQFAIQRQDERKSTYWPRLSTEINGYIDWGWHALDIYRFVCAFDDPYKGASTFLNEKKVFLKDCVLERTQEIFHPFQAGLIYRKSESAVFVALHGGAVRIGSIVDANGENMMKVASIGDRFVTPHEVLEGALARVSYTSSGLKRKK
jgi:methionyl-tRNA formyltransferase